MTAQQIQALTISGDIKFSKNWNSKLNCRYFTTIRINTNDFYKLNGIYRIIKEDMFCFRASVIKITKSLLHQVPEMIVINDIGCTYRQSIEVIKTIYPDQDLTTVPVQTILLENIEF